MEESILLAAIEVAEEHAAAYALADAAEETVMVEQAGSAHYPLALPILQWCLRLDGPSAVADWIGGIESDLNALAANHSALITEMNTAYDNAVISSGSINPLSISRYNAAVTSLEAQLAKQVLWSDTFASVRATFATYSDWIHGLLDSQAIVADMGAVESYVSPYISELEDAAQYMSTWAEFYFWIWCMGGITIFDGAVSTGGAASGAISTAEDTFTLAFDVWAPDWLSDAGAAIGSAVDTTDILLTIVDTMLLFF